MSITVAVDANGADLGPSEVALGAAEAAAQGVRGLLYGPAGELGPAPQGGENGHAPRARWAPRGRVSRSSTRRCRSPGRLTRWRPCARLPTPGSSAPRAPWPTG